MVTMVLAVLVGCCSKRHATSAMEVRRADTLVSLSSLRSGTLDRERVTETVVMRPDSTGTLRVVARDVVRVTDHGTATVSDTVRRETTAKVEARSEAVEMVAEVVEPGKVRVRWTWVVIPWALLSLLVTVCAFYLVKKGQGYGHQEAD